MKIIFLILLSAANHVPPALRAVHDYLVTVESLEKLTGMSIPVEDYLKQDKPERPGSFP